MKKLFLCEIICLLLLGCSSFKKYDQTRPELSVAFTDTENLPSVVLFDEEYYNENSMIFFVLSDYMQNYSKFAKYNVNSKQIVKIIFEAKDNERIREYCNANGIIVFSVLIKDEFYSHDIYLYNIDSDKLTKINADPLNKSDDVMPLSLKTDGVGIVYVDQNFENDTSSIKYYDISNGKIEDISVIPFTDTDIKASIFFSDINSGTIIYDRINNGKLEIIVYDVNSKTTISVIEPLEGVALDYRGLLNKENNFIALYSQAQDGDIIYIHDLKNNKNKRLVSFDQYSMAYNDMLYTKNNDILYNVQRNVSGNVKDHYYGEVYRLNNYSMEQIFKCFNISIGIKYIAFLKFDDQGIKTIHFELYKYM
ncbi:hypothetical protein AGMMS49587_10300 [Spirochaetia bacterium]|nr:hypothetical protein AGMMS49587_10300 [Spirochaetia bacterium]